MTLDKHMLFRAGVAMLVMLALTGCRTAPIESSTPVSSPIGPGKILTLRNDALTVRIAPRIGRIYDLIPAGESNLIWHENPDAIRRARQKHRYMNWGGDKLWPSLQLLWPKVRRGGGTWPPIPPIDGGEWHVLRQSDRSVVMQSQVSDALGIQVTRTITLDAIAPRLTIINTLTRLKANPLPVMIWAVTQVHIPSMALLNIAADRPQGEWATLNLFNAKHDPKLGLTTFAQAARWIPRQAGSYKFGTFGRWVAAVYDHRILLESTRYDPDACYPDRSNIQMFNNPRYMELETLSPSVHLQPGRSLTNIVVWQLLDRPPLDDAKLADWLNEQSRQPLPAPPHHAN